MPPKYLRRAISLPLVTIFLLLAIVLLPIWMPLTALADVITGPSRVRFTRLGLVLILLGINELHTVGILFLAWLRSGVGTRVWTDAGQVRMQHALRTYGVGLVESTRKALGVKLVTSGLDEALEPGGPLLVLGHHTSLLDSAIPVDLLGPRGFGLSYVIKESLAYAPAFDIGGHMLPIHFVNRSGKRTSSEMDSISELARALHGRQAFVLFPEGSFYNKRRHAKGVERLKTDAPHLVERAEKLRHTLPPRAGGVLAMLAGSPDADVMFMAHAGLESFNSIPNIMRNIPLPRPVRLDFWRVPRAEIPSEPGAQYDWLFEQFERIDRFVISELDREGITSTPEEGTATR